MFISRSIPLGLVLGLVAVSSGKALQAAQDAPPANAEPAPRPAPQPGGPGAEMTPEQRRARVLRVYKEVLTDLSTEQEDKIFATIEASNAEVRAARADEKLTPEQKLAAVEKLRAELPKLILPIFTESQKKKWAEYLEEQRQIQESTIGKMGELQEGESREEKRARITAGYEEILEELSIKKRSAILEALGAEDDALAAISDKTTLTEKQRQEEIAKVKAAAQAKITPLLNKDQQARWKKAQAVHEANAAKAEAEAKKAEAEEAREAAKNPFAAPAN